MTTSFLSLWTVSAKAGFGAHLALESEIHLEPILYWTGLKFDTAEAICYSIVLDMFEQHVLFYTFNYQLITRH
jgi:hypothetical protein